MVHRTAGELQERADKEAGVKSPLYKTVILTPFGEVTLPDVVRQRAYASAIRKHRNVLKVQKYAQAVIYRWAQGTAFFLWRAQ